MWIPLLINQSSKCNLSTLNKICISIYFIHKIRSMLIFASTFLPRAHSYFRSTLISVVGLFMGSNLHHMSARHHQSCRRKRSSAWRHPAVLFFVIFVVFIVVFGAGSAIWNVARRQNTGDLERCETTDPKSAHGGIEEA